MLMQIPQAILMEEEVHLADIIIILHNGFIHNMVDNIPGYIQVIPNHQNVHQNQAGHMPKMTMTSMNTIIVHKSLDHRNVQNLKNQAVQITVKILMLIFTLILMMMIDVNPIKNLTTIIGP